MKKQPAHTPSNVFPNFVTVLAIVSLAITFIAAGLMVCSAPQTTETLAQHYSGTDNTDAPFSQDELVRAAIATRDYTVGSHDRAALIDTLASINNEANTKYAQADEATLLAAPESFTLNQEALLHLDDVYNVMVKAFFNLSIIATIALASLFIVGTRIGKKRFGGVLLSTGALVVALFAVLALWVLIDFNGFFALFHSLFFAEGTWTFSFESLLITMYPPAFWIGMGGVWLAVSSLLSILAIITGLVLRRRSIS